MANREKITYRQALNEALHEEMQRDESVFVLGQDIAGGAQNEDPEMSDAWGGPFGVTKGLVGKFGKSRVRDTPITEGAIVGCAAGAAATGMRPIVELMFIDFLGFCLDQIMNQASAMRYMFGGKAKVPMVMRTMIGGGFSAAAQHSHSCHSILVHLPGLKLVTPATPYDAKGLLKSAIRDDDLVIFVEHKGLYDTKGPVPEEEYLLPIGKGHVAREGSDITVVAFSKMVLIAYEAAEKLAQDDISVEVVDPRSMSPLDEALILNSVRKTGHLIVVDEDNPRCSIATDVVALVSSKAFSSLQAPPKMLTPPHTPVPFSPELEKFYLPNADKLVELVNETVPAHA